MLTFPSDHDVFESIPCGFDGSRHSAGDDGIDYLIKSEAAIEEFDNGSDSQILTDLIPCENTRTCLLRIYDDEMSYTELGDLCGMHRGTASRRVHNFIEQLK